MNELRIVAGEAGVFLMVGTNVVEIPRASIPWVRKALGDMERFVAALMQKTPAGDRTGLTARKPSRIHRSPAEHKGA